MSKWQSSERSMGVWLNNQSRSLQVALAVDDEGGEPSKIAIYEPAGARSELFSGDGLAQAIGQISSRYGIEPGDVEWYAVDDKQEPYKVDVSSRTVLKEDLRMNAVRSDMPADSAGEVLRAFPEMETQVLTTALTSVNQDQLNDLDTWFNSERVNASEFLPARQYSHQEWLDSSMTYSRQPEPDHSESP